MQEKEYLKEAKKYLISFEEVTEEILENQLNEWRKKKPTNIKGLYKAFLLHAKNRQGMPNSIGDISELSDILFNYNPTKVLKKYRKWEQLFDEIKDGSYEPPGRMVKRNNKNYWVIYCKAILSIAEFLSSYKSIEEFDEFVKGFYTNEHSRVALPLLLEKELFGFGFALACDFLKEWGYPEFIKPDTHIKDIAKGLGLTKANTDFEIFKDVVAYCQRINKLPYEVDKLFWLIGSGNFYLSGIKINSSKRKFLEQING